MIEFHKEKLKQEQVTHFRSGNWYKTINEDSAVTAYIYCSTSYFNIFTPELQGPNTQRIEDQNVYFANLKGSKVYQCEVKLTLQQVK